MSIFQQAVIKKHLSSEKEKIQEAYKSYAACFHNPKIQENIRNGKEEQFQEGFLRELFVNVLGYTLFPAPDYNLITEKKNENNAEKADGAILINGETVGVIELKDRKTFDLKTVEKQAFNYKNHHRKAVYVITSNFEKLRFYIDNAIDFIEFNLFTLSPDEFAVLWLCLAYSNIEKDLPKTLKTESINNEDQITKQLYKDYSAFKQALYADLISNNQAIDKLTLFQKSQKLLDRLLFIFFAEDRNLLPPNSISEIITQWEQLIELDEYRPLYERVKKYFGYMNEGLRRKKYDIFAYNGGLFKPDEVLDNVIISDEVLRKHALLLSRYDFGSEVDVNILGHIFEHSLTEIEEITRSLSPLPDGEVPPEKSKRKRDGVFYTPRYITTYIVENTLGKLCADKKAELQINEADYFADKKRSVTVGKKLTAKLDTYREWLLSLTICDPACGSGAFLNATLDFLMNEHRLIDEMTSKISGHSLPFSSIENAILENNLYGVDINEESVEIAKLALWLRTAKPNRKLNSLNNNIKCGNSLISDPTVAGDKAFDWQKEFPHVFERGGFDVVMGNPPYVRLEHIRKMSEALETQRYQTFDKRGDIYCVFVERGFQLLKPAGFISFIMPNKWMQAGYGKALREYFLSKEMVKLIDFGDIQIFEDATTYPCIFTARNTEPSADFSVSVLKAIDDSDFNMNVQQTEETFSTQQFSEEAWVISSQKEKCLLERLQKENPTLEEFVQGQAFYGIKTGLTEAFLIDGRKRKELIEQDPKSIEIIRPVLRGRDIKPFGCGDEDFYLIAALPSLKIDIEQYPAVKHHLLSFGYDRLTQTGEKGARKKTNNKWFETQDSIGYWEQFAKPKIMYQKFQVKPCFIYDEKGLFCNDSMWIIPTENKALLAILNSKMGWWLITKYCTQIQNGYQLIWNYFGKIPVPDATREHALLSELADRMLSLNAELQAKRQRFLKSLSNNFNGIKITGALEQFDKLDFKQFLAELKKQKISLSLKQQEEWEEYFNDYKSGCNIFAEQIDTTDKEIDRMVYELYGLTEEEIEIVKHPNDK
ncbi:Type IIS restriction enzyme Eco57I [Bacteroidales bacterium Barb4]|nr:Type IIS restriction enzyme Eco57I [Bacteroidales bacterium Barb4]